MSGFKILIVETLSREIEVEANNLSDAINIIDEKYKNSEIVLTADDFVSYDIKPLISNEIG